MSFDTNETRTFWDQFPEGASLRSLQEQCLVGESAQHEFIDNLSSRVALESNDATAQIVELPRPVQHAGELAVQASA